MLWCREGVPVQCGVAVFEVPVLECKEEVLLKRFLEAAALGAARCGNRAPQEGVLAVQWQGEVKRRSASAVWCDCARKGQW